MSAAKSGGAYRTMVRYRRNLVAGGTYFFTVTLADRRSSALVEHINVLRAAFRNARRVRPYSIDAIVVLPEHLHVVMTLPPDDAAFSARWKLIKAAFTTRRVADGVNMLPNSNGEYPLWQRRFWEHTVRNDADFERHVNYIHFNPVKHGFVTAVNEWPYSSFHYYVRRGILPKDWGGSVGSSNGGFGERKD